MKQLYIITLMFFLGAATVTAQTMSCQEVYEIVTEQYDSKDTVNCYMSTMLAKATYYQLEGMGFVVAYIKRNKFDMRGKPYIFCGISSTRWRSFKSGGMYGSWGKSFHKYIREYTCDCD